MFKPLQNTFSSLNPILLGDCLKSLLLTSSLLVIVFSSILGLSFYYFDNNIDSSSEDHISINSVKISDPCIRCFTTPCFFRVIELNFSVTNSFERTLNLNSHPLYSLHIIPDANHSEILFSIHDYHSQNSTMSGLDTLPIGTWNNSYSAMLSLSRMLTADEVFPSIIKLQLSLGNEIITSSVFSINLKI